ncbi:unnamed protein product, partial [Linum tenue]
SESRLPTPQYPQPSPRLLTPTLASPISEIAIHPVSSSSVLHQSNFQFQDKRDLLGLNRGTEDESFSSPSLFLHSSKPNDPATIINQHLLLLPPNQAIDRFNYWSIHPRCRTVPNKIKLMDFAGK